MCWINSTWSINRNAVVPSIEIGAKLSRYANEKLGDAAL